MSVSKGSLRRLHRLVSLFMVAAVLLLWHPPASGQKLPTRGAQKSNEPVSMYLTGLLDREIDKEIERIKWRADKILAESTGAGEETAGGGPLGLAANANELREVERIRSELLIDLGKQIDTLKELKEIRKDNASYGAEILEGLQFKASFSYRVPR
jgi:hypothetical protein